MLRCWSVSIVMCTQHRAVCRAIVQCAVPIGFIFRSPSVPCALRCDVRRPAEVGERLGAGGRMDVLERWKCFFVDGPVLSFDDTARFEAWGFGFGRPTFYGRGQGGWSRVLCTHFVPRPQGYMGDLIVDDHAIKGGCWRSIVGTLQCVTGCR